MWLLVFVLLSPVNGIPKFTVLESFKDESACTFEKEYVRQEMAKAYPNDKTYRIECLLEHKNV